MVDEGLQKRLLDHAGALGMTAWRQERTTLMLGVEPDDLDAHFDLRGAGFMELLVDGLAAMARTDNRLIGVMGVSPKDQDVLIDVVLREAPCAVRCWPMVRVSSPCRSSYRCSPRGWCI